MGATGARAIPVLARYATWRYDTRGQEGLREMLQSVGPAKRGAYWLFDENWNELSGYLAGSGCA